MTKRWFKTAAAALLSAALIVSAAACSTSSPSAAASQVPANSSVSSAASQSVSTSEVKFTLEIKSPRDSYEKKQNSTGSGTLGDYLKNNKLVESKDGDYGMYIIAVNGMKEDTAKKQWWCVEVNGQSATTGVSSIKLEEGKTYTLELKEGY